MSGIYRPTKKRKDGTVWVSQTLWARYMYRGKQRFRNTHTDNEAKAKRMLKVWEGNPKLADPQTDRVTIEDLGKDVLTDYRVNHRKTLGHAEARAARIVAAFGERRAISITGNDAKEYVVAREAEGFAPATINRDLSVLIRMFSLGMESGKITQAPKIKKLKEDNVRKGFVGAVEQLALEAHMPLWLKVMTELAYTVGWRKGELQPLLRKQIDFPAKQVRLEVGETKNDEGRVITLTPDLYEKLLRLEMETKELEQKLGKAIPFVFHWKNGKPIKDFRGTWARVCKEAGVGEILFHDYRRTAVRNMERARVPRSAAMKITGHRTESTYRRYSIVDQDALDDAMSRIATYQNGVQTEQEDGKKIEAESKKTNVEKTDSDEGFSKK